MPIKYIGRESHFHGKSLFEIARHLKNFGKGRYVYRNSFSKRYEEPCFYKLTSIIPDMNAKGYCQGTASGEKIFRGRNYGVCNIDSGMKHDWRLIPRDQEQAWLDSVKKVTEKAPNVTSKRERLPPLMELIVREEILSEGLSCGKEIEYDVIINKSKYNTAVQK